MESHLFVILTLASRAVLTLCIYLRSFIRFVYLASKIPGPSLWEFLTIHARNLMFVDTTMEALIRLAESSDYKPHGIWLKNGHFAVVVTDGESVQQVFKNAFMKNKPGHLYDVFTSYVGKGLITLNGPEHKRHRRILSPAFRKAAVETHLPKINEEVSKLIERIREESHFVNFNSLLQDKVQTVVTLILAGVPCRAYGDIHKAYFRVFKLMSGVIRTQAFNPFWPLMKRTKSIRTKRSYAFSSMNEMNQVLIEQEIPRFMKQMEDDNTEPTNVGECMGRHFNCEDCLTYQELIPEVYHVFGASAESTDFAECVCLYLLALHPEVQERVYDEVQSILGESDRAVEPEDLSRMVYLDMVIKEAFRLFPPIPNMARNVDEETNFQGILLPKDCTILVDLISLHRNPSHFEDPLKFDPERFSAERSLDLHPFAYLPFSYGKRDCIGQTYAMLTLKASLSRVIKNFRVYPTEASKGIADIKYAIHITFVIDDMPLQFVARNNTNLIVC